MNRRDSVDYGERLAKWIDRGASSIAMLCIAILTLGAVIQVSSRMLNASIMWTEELSRYAFIWATMFAAVSLTHRSGHAVVDFLSEKLQRGARRLHSVFVDSVFTVTSLILSYYGVVLVSRMGEQTSPSLGIRMSWVYASVPIAFGLISVLSLIRVSQALSKRYPEGPAGDAAREVN